MTPELFQSLIGLAFAALLRSVLRRVLSPGTASRCTQIDVAVSIDHGLAGTDVVVRVSSDLNKSSRDLCS